MVALNDTVKVRFYDTYLTNLCDAITQDNVNVQVRRRGREATGDGARSRPPCHHK
jgi:hypothetical protein